MPFYAHNRYWAAENIYARQNGGNYDFIVEPDNQMAIPTEQRFWDDLMSNATQWGMTVYEQDVRSSRIALICPHNRKLYRRTLRG